MSMRTNLTSNIQWRTASYSWSAAEEVAGRLGIPFPAAVILASRGYTDPEKARAFLACPNSVPDPFLFRDMEATVASLAEAIASGRRVTVHGDYDADGITATALMVAGLRDFGLEAEWYLPNRFTEGYGLSRSAVETIAAGGPGLLVTVDCGVNYPQEVAVAEELGLDVVVVDHHEPGPVLPDCLLIHATTGDYPNADLCGVGLAFKVLHALHHRLRGGPTNEVPEELHGYLDLVAVGTIADLAPILGENRYYVKEGLKLVSIGRRTGFRALSAVAGCAGNVDSGAVGFRIAPRLNAAGRLGDASPPLELLLTDDERRATDISQRLHELNGERQDVEKRILEDAIAQVDALSELPPILVLAGSDWHEGVVGIVSSRLVERYHRPTILLSGHDGVAKGSGRSIPGYDLVAGLTHCAQWLTVYGGHTMAVGLTLDIEHIEAFKKAIEEHAGSVLQPSDLLPVYQADAVLRGEDINADTASALAALGPFGSGNPRPRLVVLDAELVRPEVTRTGDHLRCLVEVEGVRARAIGFGMGEWLPELQEHARRRVLGVQLRNNEWQGMVRPEFVLDRIGEAADSPVETARCDLSCPHRHAPQSETTGAKGVPGVEGAPAGGRTTPLSARPMRADLLRAFSARDLRDDKGRMAAIGQVLATGERALLLVCSLPHSLSELHSSVPLEALAGGEVGCMGKCCWRTSAGRLDERRVVVAEWDAVVREVGPARGRTHVLALDPPYRDAHVSLLEELAAVGARVHLLYGGEERDRTGNLLKYLVHPRFAMVCVYRALMRGDGGKDVHRTAATLAWDEGGVVLSPEDLQKASEVLSQLGIERPLEGEAKIEASTAPLYVDAEAEYEECSRLCRTL